ncbi:hypothetical protein RJ641_007679 [Dillenia turbinata]|uniref:Uncharacterized protein n=1 Tax=Dillenia turbinata TaxID=194707 RepID=A0AAN8V1P1_9MAGN
MLDGNIDAHMAGDLDKRKSTSGYLMTFTGGAVSGQSKLQKIIALFTMEVNGRVHRSSEACKETLWLLKFLQHLESKMLFLEKVHTNDNHADMLTKVLPREAYVLQAEGRIKEMLETENFKTFLAIA